MVKYYGRARQRIGSVNTNQLGLKMSGCPSKIGRQGYINRYMGQRVNCMVGVCGYPKVNGAIWRHSYRNTRKFCKGPASKCSAAAGGIRTTYVPYYKSVAPGVQGCGIPYKNIKKLPTLVFKAGSALVNGDQLTGYIMKGAAIDAEGLGVALESDGAVVAVVATDNSNLVNVVATPPLKKDEVIVIKREGAEAEEKKVDEQSGKPVIEVKPPLQKNEVVEVSIPERTDARRTVPVVAQPLTSFMM